MPNQFTCHWDESGADPGVETKSKSDTPLLGVGGYLAHVDEWKIYEVAWNQLLRSRGLPFFHMTEFANLRFPYSKWSEPDREAFMDALLKIINDNTRAAVVFAIETDAYMEVIKAKNLLDKDIVRAFHICARKCIEWVSICARIAGHQDKILHIFDQGNSAWTTFAKAFTPEVLNAYNILQPIARRKTDIISLQSADVLVHQVVRNFALSAGLVPANNQRLYSTKLFGKPGTMRYIDVPTLSRMYREELVLEELQLRDADILKVLDLSKVNREQQMMANAVFRSSS